MEEEIKPLTVSPINPNMVIHVDEDTGEKTTLKQMEQAIDEASVATDEVKGSSVGLTATRSIIRQIVSDEVQLNKKYGLNVSDMCGKGHEKVNGKCPKCGRPTDYTTDEDMAKKVNEYLDSKQDDYKVIKKPYIDKEGKEREAADIVFSVQLPTHEGFALMLGVNSSTLYEWEKEHPEFSKSLEKIKDVQRERLINQGLAENYNSTIAKLILSANHGMAEKTSQDITSKGEQVNGLAVTFVKPKE